MAEGHLPYESSLKSNLTLPDFNYMSEHDQHLPGSQLFFSFLDLGRAELRGSSLTGVRSLITLFSFRSSLPIWSSFRVWSQVFHICSPRLLDCIFSYRWFKSSLSEIILFNKWYIFYRHLKIHLSSLFFFSIGPILMEGGPDSPFPPCDSKKWR